MLAEPKSYKRKCKHFVGLNSDDAEKNERVVCKFYPNEIPSRIAYGSTKCANYERARRARRAKRASRFVETEDNPSTIVYDKAGRVTWPPVLAIDQMD